MSKEGLQRLFRSHYIDKCRECGAVVRQCRCPSPSKTVKLVVCPSCADKVKKTS